jgi:hypothetical protein
MCIKRQVNNLAEILLVSQQLPDSRHPITAGIEIIAD